MHTNIILIGMAASGKSTVGHQLAERLGWAYVDTDQLIEAWWGAPLHRIAASLGKEAFLEAEAEQLCKLGLKRCVIATGGSAVYSEPAMLHLQTMGCIVYLQTGLAAIEKRLTNPETRGLAIAPGQSIRDLYEERVHLYERYAHVTVSTEGFTPQQISSTIAAQLQTAQEAS